VVLALVLLRGAPAVLRSVAHRQEEVRQRIALAAHSAALVDVAQVLDDSLRAGLAQLLAAAPQFVEGRFEAEAGAALQALVEARAGGSGLKVVSVTPAPDSAAGPVRRVAVRAQLEGDARGVSRFLQAVEDGEPLLTVSSLMLTVADPAPGNGPEVVRLELLLKGWFVPRVPS
jgi:hypothetical protein